MVVFSGAPALCYPGGLVQFFLRELDIPSSCRSRRCARAQDVAEVAGDLLVISSSGLGFCRPATPGDFYVATNLVMTV